MKMTARGAQIFIMLMALVLPVMGLAESREKILFYQSALNQINKGPFEYTCGALIHEQNNCSHIFNLFERDKSTGMFFGMISDSPWDACKKGAPSSKEISFSELEKKLAADSKTTLGLRPNFFNSRSVECMPKNTRANSEDAENQKKFIVAMGYDYLNRIKKNTAALADEVKKLNSILGAPIETDLPCGQFSMPLDAKICLDIKNQKCAPGNELGPYTDSLIENAIEPLVVLKKMHKDMFERFSKTRTMRRPANQEALKNITSKIQFLESQFPILKGKTLGSYLESKAVGSGAVPPKSELMEKVKAQLVENRSALAKKLVENVYMNDCLVYGDSGNCKKFEENFERVPRHEPAYFNTPDKSPNGRLKNLAAGELYNSAQCLDNFRGLKKEFNNFSADFAINVGLTIFTGGSGLLFRAGGQGVKAALATHRIALAADAAFLGVGIEEAVTTCSKELNNLEGPEKAAASSENGCPASLSKPEYILTANYQSCITGAMMASVNGLPFVPAVATKYLSRTKAAAPAARAIANEASDLMKFKAPRKAFDPHDLRVTGDIIPAGKVQDAAEVFKRDGVYVYIIDDKGNMVISHRAPDLSAGTKEGDQFLGTHRGLFNKLRESEAASSIVSAGEIRVVGGFPIKVNSRAGSFHTTFDEVLVDVRKSASPADKENLDKFLKEYNKLAPEDKTNPWMVEMELDELFEKNPATRALYDKIKKQHQEITDKRLEIAKESLEKRGLVTKKVETKFTRDIGGDAHIEGKDAAIAELHCGRSKSCNEQLTAYQETAKKLLSKFTSVDKAEMAVLVKAERLELKDLPKKERAFQFFNQRIELLLKEGPIEFIKTGKPESYGLTHSEALKYLDEWLKKI